MSSAIALIAALALLFAAAGLMLWQRAQQRAAREHVTRFVDSRVSAAAQAAGMQGMPGASGPGQARMGTAKSDEARAAYAGGNAAPRGGALPLAAGQPQGWRARATLVLQGVLSRAGIADARKPLGFIGFVALALALWAFALGGVPAALAVLVLVVALAAFALSMRMQRRRARLVAQLPSFLDGIVRLIVLGNSVPAAFQAALLTTEAPLRECLDHVSRMLRAGVEIDRALNHVAQLYRARELELVGAVLRLSVRYGGRADVMLERMATFMRDLEQAQRELVAMSAETRLSAWVLALLPLGIAGFLIVTNPQYFASMWNDHSGRLLVYGAMGLQIAGAYLLYRLTRLKGAL
ncbi:MAG: type II secretion system F family protein [Paraburkholderia sp.]|jgi:tight adherence protein B|nr:type II secretion system F family protein [Paraburkholderia sp.]